MIARLTRAILRHRALSTALLCCSLSLSVFWAAKIQVRFSYRDFYAYPGNPQLPTYDRYTQQFGDPAGNVVLVLRSDDVFRAPYLEYVAQISRDLQPCPLFSHVRSLSTVRIPRAVGDSVVTGPIMDDVPTTSEGVAELRKAVLHSRLLSRRLISEDATVTAVLAEMRVPTAIATAREESDAIEAVREALARRPPPAGLTATVTGAPSVEVALTGALVRDQVVLTPAAVAVIAVMLMLTFRTVHGVVLALGTLCVSVLWTAGVFGFVGRPLDILGSTIPTIILVYGVVDPVFVLTRYFHNARRNLSKEAAIVETLSEMALPCFATSLTTALGFAAFLTATMPTVRYFGLIAGIGVAFSFVTTVTVLPLLLSVIPPIARPLSSLATQRLLDGWLRQCWRSVNGNRVSALAAAAVLLSIGAVAGSGLHISNSYVGTIPDGPEQRAIRLLEQKLSGVTRYVVYLEGPPGSMRNPEVLRAIADVDAAAERETLVDSSVSLPDLLAETNEAFNGGDPSTRSLPSSPSLIAQYLTLIDPDDRADFVDESYSTTHIRILAADRGGIEAAQLRGAIQKKVEQQHFERFGINASLTGNGVVTYQELDSIVTQILWGFVLAFAIVIGVEVVAFGSFRIALASIVPNLLPVAACFFAMRMLHLNLRIDSSLVLSVSIGALFNTTIHVVARIRQEVRAGATRPDEIIETSIRAVGPASLYTAGVLSAGFSVLLLSSLPGLRTLGLLSMITMSTAFFSDAIFTTLLMRLLYRWPPEMDIVRVATNPETGGEEQSH